MKSPWEDLPSREDTEGKKSRPATEVAYIVPEKYVNPETSGIADAVDSNHSGFKKIELTD
jgi:hypothetical protein